MSKDLFKNISKPAEENGEQDKTPDTTTTTTETSETTEEAKQTVPEEAQESGEQTDINSTGSTATDEPEQRDDAAEPEEDEEEDDAPQIDELAFLKQKATLMGLSFSNNIGPDALRAKIKAKLEADQPQEADPEPEQEDEQSEEVVEPEQIEEPTPLPTKEVSNVTGVDPATNAVYTRKSNKNKKMSARAYVIREKTKLVRLRITNLDPKKKDLHGEILTVANEYIGTVRKFVPFGEATDNGFHVPYCIYELLRDRKFLNIRTRKGPNNTPIVEQLWAKEFALEVLPPLTTEELARLSASQQARGLGGDE